MFVAVWLILIVIMHVIIIKLSHAIMCDCHSTQNNCFSLQTSLNNNDCIIWNSILLFAELHPYFFFKHKLDVYDSYMYEPFE